MSLLRRIEKGGGSGGQGGSGGSGGDNPPPEDPKLAALRARKQSMVGPDARSGAPAQAGRTENSYMDLKARVQQKLLNEMDQSMDISRKA
ncbi:MAG: hypothetical protein U0694_27065, partial [Anaerolineae bacterium]